MFRTYSKYEVFDDGKIWSYSRNKFLKTQTNQKGYKLITLIDNEGIKKWYQVHRVIYESVTGEQIPEGMQINHINEDKSDNRFCNLNLMTPKENSNWGTRNERCSKARINGKCSKQVGAFKNNELIMVFPSTRECGRQGFCQVAVSACCRNCYIREGNNIYKGFTWRYI